MMRKYNISVINYMKRKFLFILTIIIILIPSFMFLNNNNNEVTDNAAFLVENVTVF